MKTEIQDHASFNAIRYANCWEDADILIKALEPAGKVCASIGSAGDNSFSLLAAGARKVHVVEMNPAQLACIHLRKAAYQELNYHEFLELHGEKEGSAAQRLQLYERCRVLLPVEIQHYWDSSQISLGYGQDGKFERYFTLFRTKILSLIHSPETIGKLYTLTTVEERTSFYERSWNNLRWKLLFKVFFSRFMMGRLGRDPAFFKYVEGSVADRILKRTKYALTVLPPNENPYLTWILKGQYHGALPSNLREESFHRIKKSLSQFHIHAMPLEEFLSAPPEKIEGYNLSDIFEYMSEENTRVLSETIKEASAPKARLAYWNMLAPRSLSEINQANFTHLTDLSEQLFLEDKAFFYSRFLVDEVG